MSNQPSQPENPSNPPPVDPVFPPGWAKRLLEYWKKYRPRDYRYLLESGLAVQSFREQGQRALDLQSRLTQDGLDESQISEIVADQVFPPSEEEQPDLLSPPPSPQDGLSLLEQEEQSSGPEPPPPPEATTSSGPTKSSFPEGRKPASEQTSPQSVSPES